MFLRFNTSLRRLQREIGVTYKTIHRRVEHSTRTFDAPQLDLVGPVEIGEVYVSAGLKGRKRDQESCSHGLSTRRRGSYEEDKPPVFTIADRGTGQRCVVPAKSADESTVRLLFADHEERSLTTYTDGLRAYDPLEDDDEFYYEYVAHGGSEYADGDIRISTCESHASLARRWLSPYRDVSKNKLTRYFRAFQLCSEFFRRPDRGTLKHAAKATL